MMNKIFIGLLLCPAVYLHGAEPADSTLRLMEEITVAANRQPVSYTHLRAHET